MRKQRRKFLLFALVAFALLSGFCWLVFRNPEPPEPVYKEKRLSEWLGEDPGPAEVNLDAEKAVRQIGTNAIPTLLRMIRAHDSLFKRKLIRVVEKQHFITINFVSASQRNWEAAVGFQWLGAEASNAVPALVQIYDERISDDSQIAACYALGRIGPTATAAVPVLLRTVANTNDNAELRGTAAVALGEIHAQLDLVLPVLIKSLKDSEPDIRDGGAVGLMSLGSDAKSAVPALIVLLNDPNPDVKSDAEEALKNIDPKAAAKAGIK